MLGGKWTWGSEEGLINPWVLGRSRETDAELLSHPKHCILGSIQASLFSEARRHSLTPPTRTPIMSEVGKASLFPNHTQ